MEYRDAGSVSLPEFKILLMKGHTARISNRSIFFLSQRRYLLALIQLLILKILVRLQFVTNFFFL